MDFKKERNFIIACEEENIMGKWDIITGQFIGKSGRPVVNPPSCFKYDNLPYAWGDNVFGAAIRFYREHVLCYHSRYVKTDGERFEQLISVGLLPRTVADLKDTTRLTKELVKQVKECNAGIYDHSFIIRYNTERQYKSVLQNKPEWYVTAFLTTGYPEISYDFRRIFLDRCLLEKVNYFWKDEGRWTSNKIVTLMHDYYTMCKAMYGEVKVNHNILTSFAHINALYKEYINAHYDETLKNHNDKSFLKFTFGDYEAFPLLTREQFHKEGTENNNCVERLYMEKVSRGETYITVIRRINTPEKSLITCEVGLDGSIQQYLLRSNYRVTQPDLLQFREMYQDYIICNISKE